MTRHEGRLRRMVAFRLDPRLQGRVAPEDVLQDVYLAAAQNLCDYLGQPATPFFFWLRGIAGHKLLELQRRHLGTRMRDARREVSLHRGALPDATSAALAAQLLGHQTRPSEAAVRAEAKLRLQEALNGMDPIDREVLALRHFEQLSNAEAARVLQIKETAAGKRYLRRWGVSGKSWLPYPMHRALTTGDQDCALVWSATAQRLRRYPVVRFRFRG